MASTFTTQASVPGQPDLPVQVTSTEVRHFSGLWYRVALQQPAGSSGCWICHDTKFGLVGCAFVHVELDWADHDICCPPHCVGHAALVPTMQLIY